MNTLLTDQMTIQRHEGRITVRIPMELKVRGGRKEVILPDHLLPEQSPAHKPAVQDSLVIALARAHRWKISMESGRFGSVEELAHALKMDSSYVGRILRLTLLAPDIITAILEGHEPSGLSLGMLTKTLPMDWVEQRKVLGFHH
jgi:hypothetical protein